MIATKVTSTIIIAITMMVTLALTVWMTRTIITAMITMITIVAPMAIAGFLLQDKLGKTWFFQKTFWVVLEMSFFTHAIQAYSLQRRSLSGGFTWLQTTKQVELFNIKEFATTAPGVNNEAFMAWFKRQKIFILFAKYKLPYSTMKMSLSQSPPSIQATTIFFI